MAEYYLISQLPSLDGLGDNMPVPITEERFTELCRRFLADCDDFSEEKLAAAGIVRRFSNNGDIEDCINEIISEMKAWKK